MNDRDERDDRDEIGQGGEIHKIMKSVQDTLRRVRILVLFYLNRELYYLLFYGRLHYTYTCTKTRHNTLKSVMGRRRVKRM